MQNRIDTLMEGVKLAVGEVYLFEFWAISTKVSLFENSDAMLKLNDFVTQSTIRFEKNYAKTLVKEIRLVVTLKDEFEHRFKSKLKA